MPSSPIPAIDGPGLLAAWPPRLADSHKGSHGHLVVVGGSAGMRGAAVLAAQAGLWAGAGRVSLAFADGDGPQLVAGLPELLLPSPADLAGQLPGAATVLGPGLGRSDAARGLYARVAAIATTLVIDADALTLLAEAPPQHRLPPAGQHRLLTPHPGEAARLLAMPTAAVQADRAGAARRLARDYGALVVLKGAGSLVASPAGELLRNPSGNPGMAAAGMGDTLAGLLGALLAQGHDPLPALCLATWLHGAAADLLVAEGCGPRGLTASEVAQAARRLVNRQARWPGAASL